MTTEQKLLNTAKETFITQRTQQELLINKWAEGLATTKDGILDGIVLPEPLTLRTLIPELYVEKPNHEIYEKQYEEANTLINAVNAVADEYNEEALRCLSEYNQMTSGQR